jgi:hypothetical protein
MVTENMNIDQTVSIYMQEDPKRQPLYFICSLFFQQQFIIQANLNFNLNRYQPYFSLPLYREPMAFLLALPGRDLATLLPAFIFLGSKPLRSPELMASPDLAWRFLPPKPYFSSFLARLWPPALAPCPRPAPERGLWLFISFSTPTSKMSASLVSRPAPPVSERSSSGC